MTLYSVEPLNLIPYCLRQAPVSRRSQSSGRFFIGPESFPNAPLAAQATRPGKGVGVGEPLSKGLTMVALTDDFIKTL